jgi:hypothetical protein
MSNIQKRGSYTPRRVKEQKAFRLVLVGGTSGAAGVLLGILAIAGASTGFPAIVLIIIAVACYGMFRGVTS